LENVNYGANQEHEKVTWSTDKIVKKNSRLNVNESNTELCKLFK
jgi:hypothetical protein